MAMPATNSTTTAMIMVICIVLNADRFIACLQLLLDFYAIVRNTRSSRLFVDFFHLADFLLNLPGYLFAPPSASKSGAFRHLAHLFLQPAFYFVNLPRNLILSAWARRLQRALLRSVAYSFPAECLRLFR